jgi:DNA-binding transcriptional LysR family regulator
LLNLDFNALRTLRLVYQLGSFSDAADAIEVKQSTVSYTIDRLRKALNDPLIVRQGSRNVATERCRELIPIIDRILAEAEGMEDQGNFDPSKSKAQITIICTAFGLRVILPNVFRRVRKSAPGIGVNFLERYHGVSDLLQEGKADIALTVTEIEGSGIYSRPALLKDFAVCIMDPHNPLVGRVLTHKDVEDADHIAVRLWANWVQPYETVAESLGIKINQVLTVTNPAILPTLIEGTDLISALPSGLAGTYENQLGVAHFPFKVPVSLNMHWPAASNRSKLSIWLRNIIVEESEKLVTSLDL